MRNTALYLLAKKIHRFLVLGIVTLGLVMVITGLSMYFGASIPGLDPNFIVFLHRSVSIIFSVVLLGMMITGSYLYIFPHLPIPKKPTT